MQHTLPTINFHPDIELKVNVSLRGGASDTPVGGCCWPALGEQLVHSSKARGFLARDAPAQAQVGAGISRTFTSAGATSHSQTMSSL